MKNKFLYLLPLVLLLVACKADLSVPNQVSPRKQSALDPVVIGGALYTDPMELENIANTDVELFIDCRVARYLATVELLAGASRILTLHPEEPWMLTIYPKVIYHYDNTPKYYESGIITSNGVTGIVATYAQKEIDGVIAYLFWGSRSEEYADMDFYVGIVPQECYYGHGAPEFYYDYIDQELKSINFELPASGTDEYLAQVMYSQMDSEDIAGMEEDLASFGENELDEFLQDRDDYWRVVSDFFNNNSDALWQWDNPNMAFETQCVYNGPNSQDDTDTHIVYQLIDELDYDLDYYNSYTLPEYSDQRLLVTRWTNYCGPAACAWVYRGKYETFDGEYLPIFGDAEQDYFRYTNMDAQYAYYDLSTDMSVKGVNKQSDALETFIERSNQADNGLTACFYKESVPFWWDNEWTFPLYHGGLNRGFAAATNDEYKVVFNCKPYDWITLNNEPVLIAVNCDHYLVAFGTGVTKKKNGRVKDKYFAVVDNGYTTKEYGYHPYMRKYNFWNLHYGLSLK